MTNSDRTVDLSYLRRLDDRLAELERCGRCERDKDEKCADRDLAADGTAFALQEVTCGCGCWTRPAARQLLP